MVFKRRELEVCVLSYVADALRCGDLYVTGSEEFADYRQQLLPWEECQQRLSAYLSALQLPANADDFVAYLQQELAQVAHKLDRAFPHNSELTIDDNGKPHLKQMKADPIPDGLDEFKEDVWKQMPERHLLDILKNVQHWVNYTRHFTPPSGSDPKIIDAVSNYLFTIFGYVRFAHRRLALRWAYGKAAATVALLIIISLTPISLYSATSLPVEFGRLSISLMDC